MLINSNKNEQYRPIAEQSNCLQTQIYTTYIYLSLNLANLLFDLHINDLSLKQVNIYGLKYNHKKKLISTLNNPSRVDMLSNRLTQPSSNIFNKNIHEHLKRKNQPTVNMKTIGRRSVLFTSVVVYILCLFTRTDWISAFGVYETIWFQDLK